MLLLPCTRYFSRSSCEEAQEKAFALGDPAVFLYKDGSSVDFFKIALLRCVYVPGCSPLVCNSVTVLSMTPNDAPVLTPSPFHYGPVQPVSHPSPKTTTSVL